MADRRAAEAELDARDVRSGTAAGRKLPQMLHDQDTDEDMNSGVQKGTGLVLGHQVDEEHQEVMMIVMVPLLVHLEDLSVECILVVMCLD
ncbi:hypothetical protein BDA96_05G120300 [Sorghum bicolor]|uniref:Uncharacterized protein n=2 Tax=Sorghum bicolor TaxID=4558 RepID=A0A921QX79_SORBI|nr:hypothetical protein BDA96_05G120300 [Sorghum bicolor]OQU83394.1 hypothetical protein SORBI_3005G110523 [Sorghum bicolor]